LLTELVTNNLSMALLAWLLLYSSDYLLTLWASRLYQGGVHETIVYGGGVELTPQFRQDVASLRKISPAWIRTLILVGVLLSVLWLLSARVLGDPALFSFMIVGIILLEVTVHIRHIRVLALFGRIRAGTGPTGRIEYPRWLLLDQSAVEFLTFALLYTLLFFLTDEIAVLGGAVFCASITFRHWLWGRRERKGGA
jgi:hypothetical protein